MLSFRVFRRAGDATWELTRIFMESGVYQVVRNQGANLRADMVMDALFRVGAAVRRA